MFNKICIDFCGIKCDLLLSKLNNEKYQVITLLTLIIIITNLVSQLLQTIIAGNGKLFYC